MSTIDPCDVANRSSNIQFYPDDWKSLPILDVPPPQQQPVFKPVEQIRGKVRRSSNRYISIRSRVGSCRRATLRNSVMIRRTVGTIYPQRASDEAT